MSKFKAGDKVRRVSLINNNETSWKGMKIGDEDIVIENKDWGLYLKKFGEGHTATCFKKAKKSNFILCYAFKGCDDPTEEFETLEEVKARIIELNDGSRELDVDSLKVYEIKNMVEVSIKREHTTVKLTPSKKK